MPPDTSVKSVTVNSGARLDALPMSSFHRRILWLIGAGMFFDSFDIYNPDELLQRLVMHKPGDQVPLTVVRGGQNVNLTVTIGEAPVQQ